MQSSNANAGLDPAAPATMTLEVQERGDSVVLKVAGMAAVEVAGQLSRALQEAAARRPKLLAVDLSGLSFISSTGLGSLVAAHVAGKKHGTRLCLIRPRPMIREVLEITRLSELFPICDSIEEAEQLPSSG